MIAPDCRDKQRRDNKSDINCINWLSCALCVCACAPQTPRARPHMRWSPAVVISDALSAAEVFGQEVQLVQCGLERQLMQPLLRRAGRLKRRHNRVRNHIIQDTRLYFTWDQKCLTMLPFHLKRTIFEQINQGMPLTDWFTVYLTPKTCLSWYTVLIQISNLNRNIKNYCYHVY